MSPKDAQTFTILAIDHQDALRRAMRPVDPLSLTAQEITEFKLDVLRAVEPEISGVLLDPTYGVEPAIAAGLTQRIDLLVELEKADYQMNPLPLRVELNPDWSVARIKQVGAAGVKLFFYYNPDDHAYAEVQDQIVRQVVADCKAHAIPLFAEPILVNSPNITLGVIESAKRIAALGADILKLEFPAPVDQREQWQAACEQLTAAVEVPWVLLSAGVNFEIFCEQVRVARQAGAAGFMVGRALWGEAAALPNRQERLDWLNTTGRERMIKLCEIVKK